MAFKCSHPTHASCFRMHGGASPGHQNPPVSGTRLGFLPTCHAWSIISPSGLSGSPIFSGYTLQPQFLLMLLLLHSSDYSSSLPTGHVPGSGSIRFPSLDSLGLKGSWAAKDISHLGLSAREEGIKHWHSPGKLSFNGPEDGTSKMGKLGLSNGLSIWQQISETPLDSQLFSCGSPDNFAMAVFLKTEHITKP